MRILTVIGNRPQFVKAAAVSRVLREHHDEVIVHTGQHYDDELSRIFFDELGVPAPDRELDAGGGTNTEQTARILGLLEGVLAQAERRTWRSSTATRTRPSPARSLRAQARVPVAHVEAGMRSFDRAMPEELNRVLADHASDLLLCSTQTAVETSSARASPARSHLVGDVMADVSLAFRPIARERSHGARPTTVSSRATTSWPPPTARAMWTTPTGSSAWWRCWRRSRCPCVLPMHPRTARPAEVRRLAGRGSRAPPVIVLPPLGYLDFTQLAMNAPRSPHRLRRRAEGGLPAGRAVRDAARDHRVGRDRRRGLEHARRASIANAALAALERRPPAGERPELYGGGKAAERIREVLDAYTPGPTTRAA